MDHSLPDEFRLAHVVLLNALVFAVCFRAARRFSREGSQILADTLLLWYAAQYLAIGLPGLAGVLNAWTASLTSGVLLAGLSWVTAGVARPNDVRGAASGFDRWVPRAPPLFVPCYVAARVWDEAYSAVMATDALIYHFPAAVDWLQSGSLGLHETWFHNPANTYSPLAGTMFQAWLIAPLGTDVAARFVQAPALLLLQFALQATLRSLGVGAILAATIAATAACCGPFFNQAFIGKDDLFVAAFFITVAAAASADRLRDPFGPWRLGLALGLLLATKYTAVLGLPAMLLLVNAPFAPRGPRGVGGIAWGCVAILGGAWYARNFWLTGNPVFPISVSLFGRELFSGQFSAGTAAELRGAADVCKVLLEPSFGVSWFQAGLLGTAWIAAWAVVGRSIASDPVRRFCVVGPLVGLACFVGKSPYAEIRFAYPSLALLLACIGLSAGRLRWPYARLAVGLIALVCFASRSEAANARLPLPLIAAAITVGLLGTLYLTERMPGPGRRLGLYATVVTVIALTAATYIAWQPYLRQYRVTRLLFWRRFYGELAEAWTFVAEELPDDSTVAYANTPLVYPLYGFELRRRVIYVPSRRGVTTMADLPRGAERLAGSEIIEHTAAVTVGDADQTAWLGRLRESRAEFLFICKTGPVREPPEVSFVASDPTRFARLFENPAAAVYRVVEW